MTLAAGYDGTCSEWQFSDLFHNCSQSIIEGQQLLFARAKRVNGCTGKDNAVVDLWSLWGCLAGIWFSPREERGR